MAAVILAVATFVRDNPWIVFAAGVGFGVVIGQAAVITSPRFRR